MEDKYIPYARWSTTWHKDSLHSCIRHHIFFDKYEDSARIRLVTETHKGDLFERVRHYTLIDNAELTIKCFMASPLSGSWSPSKSPHLTNSGA